MELLFQNNVPTILRSLDCLDTILGILLNIFLVIELESLKKNHSWRRWRFHHLTSTYLCHKCWSVNICILKALNLEMPKYFSFLFLEAISCSWYEVFLIWNTFRLMDFRHMLLFLITMRYDFSYISDTIKSHSYGFRLFILLLSTQIIPSTVLNHRDARGRMSNWKGPEVQGFGTHPKLISDPMKLYHKIQNFSKRCKRNLW